MPHDDLGHRMKQLEAAAVPARLTARQSIYARIDGRGFSRFTRGMQRPFDPRMSRAMIATAKWLLVETCAIAAYVQSDEISLLWAPGGETSEAFFGGRVVKMASVLAGMATARFTQAVLADTEGLDKWAGRLPHFDARVCQMPRREDAAAMFAWRGMDAERNAVQVAAQSHFSHKSLQGVNVRDQVARLAGAGIRMEDYPEFFRNGTLLSRVREERLLTPGELERIPQNIRPDPDQVVVRTGVSTWTRTPPHRMTNLTDRLFREDAAGKTVASPVL